MRLASILPHQHSTLKWTTFASFFAKKTWIPEPFEAKKMAGFGYFVLTNLTWQYLTGMFYKFQLRLSNMTTCDNISFQRQKHKGFLEDFAPRISTVCSNDRAESKECFPKAPQPIDGLEGFIIFILREPRKKNRGPLLSMKSWLFIRDPYVIEGKK